MYNTFVLTHQGILMPIFMSARCAIHPDGRAVQSVGLLKSDTKKGAEGSSRKMTDSEFPSSQGWTHVILVAELSRSMLLKMAEDAR
jgi:hypothetical protein